MEKISLFSLFFLLIFTLIFTCISFPQDIKTQDILILPISQTDIGKPFMKILEDRKSTREFSSEKLPLQILSNLLWAAYGINRPELGGRTSPSEMNCQDIDIYVAMADGLFLYLSNEHALKVLIPQDIRHLTGRQNFVKEAPLNLIYVSNFSKMPQIRDEEKVFFSGAGLATVVRAMIDKTTLSQTVGYPKK